MADDQGSERTRSPFPIPLGTVVGNYEVTDLLMEGDLATALLVHHQHFDRRGILLYVVIGPDTNDFIRRWLGIVGGLDHPNIVRLLDCIKWEGRLCPLLDFIPGELLFKVTPGKGTQDLLTVLRFLRPLASALAYCHERGVAHRSVKASNIIVDSGGRPFLSGFMTASQLRGDPLDGRHYMLTPPITPPEVWEYKAKCAGSWTPCEYELSQADVWAFGVLLYQLATSERLFPPLKLAMDPEQRAGVIEEVRELICDPQPLSLSTLRSAGPASVYELARGCLEKDPRRRYRNAGEVHEMLNAVIDDLERKEVRSASHRIVPGGWLLLFLEPLLADIPGRFLQVQILDHLGSGTFADVYAIREIRTSRSRTTDRHGSEADPIGRPALALKVLRTDWAGDEEVRARFRREAKCLARASNDRLVKVHGWGELGSSLFLVMDRLEGWTLHSWMMGRTPLSIGRATSIVRQVAEGLAAIHGMGLIHRDLKPDNIMIDGAGHVIIADFGMVYTAAGTRLTSSGKFLGSPAYAAPEQIMGQPPVPETDLYALAVIFYELVSGERPHGAESIPELFRQILETPPVPLETRRPDLPEKAVEVIMKGLSRDPASRFRSAHDLLVALADPILADTGLEPTLAIDLPPVRPENRDL